MNRILPNQPGSLASATRTRLQQGQNFAEALHGKAGEESKRLKPGSGHVTETGDPAKSPSLGNGRGAVAAVESGVGGPGRFTKGSGDDRTVGRRGALSDLMLADVETDAPSIGLLPEQVAWSRVYPEHLIASGYLSVVDTAEREGDMPFERVVKGGLEIHPNVDMTTPVIDGEAGVVRDTMTSLSEPWPLPLASLEDQAVSAADTEIASSPRAMGAFLLADHIWAERLMRLTRDDDGEATVWLRDYGLKESDLTPFVSKLIQHCRESGIQIGRIVINGRQVWGATRTEGG